MPFCFQGKCLCFEGEGGPSKFLVGERSESAALHCSPCKRLCLSVAKVGAVTCVTVVGLTDIQ
jgi:hypothetical protein